MRNEPLPLDPEPADTAALIDEVEASSSRFLDTLTGLGAQGMDEQSELQGWSRRVLAAHVSYVARAYLRMTDEALGSGSSVTYPGGAKEREESLHGFDNAPHARICQRFQETARALVDRWRSLDRISWSARFTEKRLGTIGLARLVALRLNELEVHRGDLTAGYGPRQWSAGFVSACLPLRVAWLPGHHRARPDADTAVVGRWLLTTGDQHWLVTADGPSARCTAAAAGEAADATIAGPPWDLLAFLLGRPPSVPLTVTGDLPAASRFKAAFPGP